MAESIYPDQTASSPLFTRQDKSCQEQPVKFNDDGTYYDIKNIRMIPFIGRVHLLLAEYTVLKMMFSTINLLIFMAMNHCILHVTYNFLDITFLLVSCFCH